jgi:hypothetical protein
VNSSAGVFKLEPILGYRSVGKKNPSFILVIAFGSVKIRYNTAMNCFAEFCKKLVGCTVRSPDN